MTHTDSDPTLIEGFLALDQKLLIQHPLFYQGSEKKVSNCIERAQQKSSLSRFWTSGIGIKILLISWLQFRQYIDGEEFLLLR